MGLSGLEPPTSRLSGARSNQLSYKPVKHVKHDNIVLPTAQGENWCGYILRHEYLLPDLNLKVLVDFYYFKLLLRRF